MKIIKEPMRGLFLIEPNVFGDNRGYFFESYNKKIYERLGLSNYHFVQDNESKSGKNILRGLHFQKPPYTQAKLVRVVIGAVIDVVVDLRKNSSTYGEHFKAEINDHNKHMLLVPHGFAHGFLTLEDNTIFQYKCDNFYNISSEGSILWSDPVLNIDWGIKDPVVSEKDKSAPLFSNFNSPF